MFPRAQEWAWLRLEGRKLSAGCFDARGPMLGRSVLRPLEFLHLPGMFRVDIWGRVMFQY